MTHPVAAILLGSSNPQLLRRMSQADLGAPPPLVALVKRLTAAGIAVTVAEDLEEARAVAGLRDHRPPTSSMAAMDDSGVLAAASAAAFNGQRVTPILLDLQSYSSDDPEDLEHARRLLGDCRAAFAGQEPIAITQHAPPRMLLECFRGGAADVIDLGHEGTARAKAALSRAVLAEENRRAQREVSDELRGLLDEVVRDLVRTERRTIELEQQLGGDAVPLTDEQVYLERIKARHQLLLARYLGLKSEP